MAQWDLSSKIVPYLDRHLVIPLLEFLSVKEFYSETDLLKAKLDVLSKTNMVDFVMDIHQILYPHQDEPLAKLREKRQKVIETFDRLQNEAEPVVKMFTNSDVTAQAQSSRDPKQLLDYLVKHHNFNPALTDACHNFAKFQFDCGNYPGENFDFVEKWEF